MDHRTMTEDGGPASEISLRDHFAIEALNIALGNMPEHGWGWDDLAADAYEIADAMLAARKAKP